MQAYPLSIPNSYRMETCPSLLRRKDERHCVSASELDVMRQMLAELVPNWWDSPDLIACSGDR